MSKFKVEFKLKQHTPIIHFQSDQIGATLRATELKPKFDKFLIEQFEKEEINYEEFLIPQQDKALDYKVKIEPNISQNQAIDKDKDKNPLFFGNMGDGKDKKFKNPNKTFKIEFFSFKPKIIEVIEKYFEAFLANTNFGTRQSKGFGSFYIDKKDFNKTLIPYTVYSFSSKDWQKNIGLLYKFLRQGINLTAGIGNPFYTKPAIFTYARSKSWEWDKKAIKSAYFSATLSSQISTHDSDILTYTSGTKYLLRDLFGLSSSQEWKSYGRTIKKEDINIDENNKPIIERFKSPITFKIIDDMVYFWVNNSYKSILNQTFNIKAGRLNNTLNLSTPNNEFNFEEFLDFAINIKLNTHINSSFHDADKFRDLKEILNKIKASK